VIQAIHAANFVTIFGLVYKLQQFEIESRFFQESTLSNCGTGKKITSANISISPPNLPDLNPTGVSCMKRNIGTLSEIRAQADQYCQAEDYFVDDMERSAMEFIEREIVKFLNIFRTWVAAAGEKFKHSETYSTWGADIRH